MSARAPADPPRAEFRLIQALRFVAALAVVVYHATYYTAERLSPGTPAWTQGGRGVQLFFVISGFVMIVSSTKLEGARGGWRAFAIKRIVRIVPLYWLIMLAKLALLAAIPRLAAHTRTDPGYVLASFLFVPARTDEGFVMPFHAVGWTLNFEMLFYLLFATALWLRAPPVRFVAAILVPLALLFPVKSPDWPAALAFYTAPDLLGFIAGMGIARAWQAGRTMAPVPAAALAAVALGGLFLPIAALAGHSFVVETMVVALAAAVIAAAVALEPVLGPRVPRWVMLLGAASYSLYLVHPIVAPAAPLALARMGGAPAGVGILAAVALALVAGLACFRYVETPVGRWLDRVVHRRGWLRAGEHAGAATSTPR